MQKDERSPESSQNGMTRRHFTGTVAIGLAGRIPKTLKDDRDLLVYRVWKMCVLNNEQTGRLFGMSYSAIS